MKKYDIHDVNFHKDFFNFTSIHNIQEIVFFHDITRNLYKKAYKYFSQKNESHKLLQLQYFDDNLSINTFLMIYSHLEEFLYLSCKQKKEKKSSKEKNRGSLSRFEKKLVDDGVHLGEDWNILLDAEKIRNCILHANRRIDISTSKEMLAKIIKENELKVLKSRIILTKTYINKFKNSAINIINAK